MIKKSILIDKSIDSHLPNQLVSIVIPIYNTNPSILQKCVQSVLNQSYQDLEILLIDDGSNKRTLSTLRELEECDNRVKIICREHEGVSAARNSGIDRAKGEWISFVDSDDRIPTSFVKEALIVAEDSQADFLCGSCESVYSRGNTYASTAPMKYYQSCEYNELKLLEHQMLGPFKAKGLEGPDFLGKGPWGKLYKTEIVKKIFFNTEITIGEDVLFNYQYMKACSSVVIVDRTWYWYYQYADSVVHSFSPEIWWGAIKGLFEESRHDANPSAFLTRCGFMSFSAIENSARTRGLLRGYQSIKMLLRQVSELGCYSSKSFQGYTLSIWVRIMVFLCRLKHFHIAYIYWAIKSRVRNQLSGELLITCDD